MQEELTQEQTDALNWQISKYGKIVVQPIGVTKAASDEFEAKYLKLESQSLEPQEHSAPPKLC